MSTLLPAALIVLTPYVGYSDSQLDWNIAGGFGDVNPNVLSELTYKDISAIETGIRLDLIKPLTKRVAFTAKADISIAKINNGTSQDSDYFANNRTEEFSRSYAAIEGSKLGNYKIGAGLTFALMDYDVLVSLLTGITRSEQSLHVHRGRQEIAIGLSEQEISGLSDYLYQNLNSTYETSWDGFWLGISTQFQTYIGDFSISYEYAQLDYEAEADWNLRDTFKHPKSFSHHADGIGNKFRIDYKYKINANWSVGSTLKYDDFKTKVGLDKTYFTDGYVGATQLNEVNWKSKGISMNLSYEF